MCFSQFYCYISLNGFKQCPTGICPWLLTLLQDTTVSYCRSLRKPRRNPQAPAKVANLCSLSSIQPSKCNRAALFDVCFWSEKGGQRAKQQFDKKGFVQIFSTVATQKLHSIATRCKQAESRKSRKVCQFRNAGHITGMLPGTG